MHWYRLSESQCALVVCAGAGVLRPTEMSCVRTWFHFPPALRPGAVRVLRPAVLTSAPEWMQARYQASTGADTAAQNPESCSSREFLAGHGC